MQDLTFCLHLRALLEAGLTNAQYCSCAQHVWPKSIKKNGIQYLLWKVVHHLKLTLTVPTAEDLL